MGPLSLAEYGIRRLIGHRPSDLPPEERIDWIHDADRDQLLRRRDDRP
jgi:hypothetical protein